jgi:hypothetical protein
MIGFLLKKWFYDLWDHMLVLGLINIGFLLSIAVPVLSPTILAAVPILSYIIAIAGVVWSCTYFAAAAMVIKSLSDGGGFTLRGFLKSIRESWRAGIALGAIVIAIAYCIAVAIPFYLGARSTIGLVAATTLFWMVLLIILVLQFFPAVRARLPGKPGETARKCLELFFDNTLFSMLVAIIDTILIAVSFFLAFMLPGPAGMILFIDEAVKLRLLKYDWLAEHQGADRKKIPWDEILAEEKEMTGTRSLKTLIFPWKE